MLSCGYAARQHRILRNINASHSSMFPPRSSSIHLIGSPATLSLWALPHYLAPVPPRPHGRFSSSACFRARSPCGSCWSSCVEVHPQAPRSFLLRGLIWGDGESDPSPTSPSFGRRSFLVINPRDPAATSSGSTPFYAPRLRTGCLFSLCQLLGFPGPALSRSLGGPLALLTLAPFSPTPNRL